MGLWSRLIRWRKASEASADLETAAPRAAEEAAKTIELPIEPFVFECQACGKVFEARRIRPTCPECDGSEVTLLSDE